MGNGQLQAYDKLVDLVYATSMNSDLWPELLEGLDKHAEQHSGLENSSIAKHIQRSSSFAQHQYVLERENTLLMCIINRLPIGVIVVNHNAEVVAINNRAQNLVDHNKSLCVHDSILQAHNQRETSRLKQGIQEQVQLQKSTGKPHIIQKNKTTSPISLWITASSYDLPNHENLVAIYIASSELRLSLSLDTLIEMYQLTPREAKFTQVLSNGSHTVRDAAKACNITYETARTYIKHIFQKTNTHNQTELIKLLLTSPAALVGEAQETKPAQSFSNHIVSNQNAVSLPNGRKIGYVEYGNPNGEPVIFCHSLIHPDEQMFHIKAMQEQLKYRVISPKRPGFLNSTKMKEHCTLQQHAHDIIELANYLGINKFKVLAHSNGCPYAAALAHDYPSRVQKLLLISPFVPPKMDSIADLKNMDRLMYKVAVYLPEKILRHLTHITLKNMTHNLESFFIDNTKNASRTEQQFIKSPELLNYIKLWLETTYPNRTKAVTQDLFVRIRDWKLNPENIHVPVSLWHAEDDTTINISCAKELASVIPNCQENYLKEGGHYIFFTHFDMITERF